MIVALIMYTVSSTYQYVPVHLSLPQLENKRNVKITVHTVHLRRA